MSESEISEVVRSLIKAKQANAFSTFIDFIQFPKYRCLVPNQRVDFQFPLTLLIGQNGSGKTSVLQALAGAPQGMSVSKYWFGTAVDPIDPDNEGVASNGQEGKQKFQGERSAFWYGYHQGGPGGSGQQLEAVKTRIWRKDDPDYWEPSRPILAYGMKLLADKKRSPQIDMKVKYLSLRFNLNAFDRCFHFSAETTLRLFRKLIWDKHGKTGKPSIQDYLRHRSLRLKKALSNKSVIQVGRSFLNSKPVELSLDELKVIGEITGKEYTSGTMIDHRFYETQGRSVVLKTVNHTYSEAFAGSGESLVVNLVTEVLKAPPNSLLLLDEPETSLHPGAQRKLLQFLLKQALAKKLQIVVSTHSPEMVRGLPNNAIKVFRPSVDGAIHVEQDLSWDEAFYVIGQHLDPSIHVIVEDKLAELLVTTALESIGATFAHKFRVEHRPGGESRMKSDIALAITTQHSRPMFLFDGDQAPAAGICDPQYLTQADVAPAKLDARILQQTGQKIVFHENSNSTPAEKSKIRLEYLQYYRDKVRFLPFTCPEAVIWSREKCEAFLAMIEGDNEAARVEAADIEKKNIKERYSYIADKYGIEIDAIHRVLVLAFQKGGGEAWTSFKNSVKAMAANENV